MGAHDAALSSRMEDFMEMCRRSGIRATHQRREVLTELVRTGGHPDVETIFQRVRERIPTISRDTVYRTLSMLEEQGLATRVDLFSDRARFDPNIEPHHHFICTECGRVVDFKCEEAENVGLPEEVRQWGEVKSVRLQVRGVCNECLGE